jgi:hypothetical protein
VSLPWQTRSININWKTLLHLLLNERKPHRHLLLSALEGPIGIPSYRRKYRCCLSPSSIDFVVLLTFFATLSKLISMCISEHLPHWSGTIIACLMWSSLSYHQHCNGWPSAVPTTASITGMLGSGGTGVLSAYIKPRFASHRRQQRLACSG